MDATNLQALKDVGSALCIIGFQAYNVYQHNRNRTRITTTAAVVASNYEDLRGDLEDARAAIEKVMVKMNGGDRRSPKMSSADARAVADQARRWKDFPNEGQPYGGAT